MCGIAGVVDPNGLPADCVPLVRAMTRELTNRGPDDHGLWFGAGAVFGHRRLAVIDPESGRQPMVLTDDADNPTDVLAYTGEVYNHSELRHELEQLGHKFHTRTDTEVVLYACREWGPRAPERFNGMFAFAYWDVRRRSLLLVRDRLGIKPLCYSRFGTGVRFASEPKALFSGGVAPVVDADGLRDLLTSVRTPGRSLFRGVHEVLPGTALIVDVYGIREHRYWRLEARPHVDELATTIDRVGDLLDDITARHLRADVPLGALLSGGLDSSVLAALAQRRLRVEGAASLRTFSVDFADGATGFTPDAVRATADAPYVAAMAAHCGLDHRDIVLDSAQLADPAIRRAAFMARDAPSSGDMDTSLYLLFRAVKAHVTVAISGESADEVFGGYSWFHSPAAAAPADYPWRYFAGRSGTCRALLRDDVATELDLTAHRANHYRQAVAEVPTLPGESAEQRRRRTLFHLHLTRWLPDLLDRKDRLSMAVGLEVRVPFCDHRLVDYAYNIPWEQHTFDGREKSLLRAAATDALPPFVAQRVKSPYPSTQDTAYDTAIRGQAVELIADRGAPVWDYLDRNQLSQRLNRADGDRATRAGIDFALNLDVWLRGLRP